MRAFLRLGRERWCTLPRALLLLPLLATTAAAQVEPVQEFTPFDGSGIPAPPQQNLKWEPPATTLPEKLVTATAKLFEQGLSDPRGCEYREVEITVGSVMGGAGRVKTHAWVLPSLPSDRHFAVGWNGLVYPVESVGEKADLRRDVLALVEADEKLRAKWAADSPNFPFYRFRHAAPEAYSLSHESLRSLKAPMLLRLGEGELARKVWDAWTAGMRAEVNDDAIHLKDPYLMLATEWVWALFDRVLTAHMRGDDRLSLLSVGPLTRIREAVESEVAARHVVPTEYACAAPGEQPRYLPFLEPVPALSIDQQMREIERRDGSRGAPTLPRRLKPTVGASTSVGELIRDLEEVSARQWGQPGGVFLGEDRVVQALIAKGEEAIEPLLWVIEKDTRLTRSVSFSRNFHYDRHLIGVHEAAYAALTGILKTSDFGSDTDRADLEGGLERRRALAARIRLYLKQYGGIPLEERWYGILADDATTLEQWRQAAAWIAMPTAYGDASPRQWVYSAVYFRRRGEKVALRGEPLRQKASPSVSQLLARRMDDSLARLADKDWTLRLFGLRDFAVALSAWDGVGGLGGLRRVTASLEKLFASEEARAAGKRSSLISTLIGIYEERFALNDPQAAADYAGWLRTLRPEDTDYEGAGLFNLASTYAGSPEIVEAVTRMFGDPSSPWSPVTGRLRYGTTDTLQFLKTGLLNFPAFRARVLEGLADRTVVGTLKPRASGPAGAYDLKVENLLAAAVAGATNMPDAVITFPDFDKRTPATVSLRACDVYAWKLRGYEGAPWIELYWTEAERDSAVAASLKFLREHGGPFVYSETRAYKR